MSENNSEFPSINPEQEASVEMGRPFGALVESLLVVDPARRQQIYDSLKATQLFDAQKGTWFRPAPNEKK